MLFIDLAKLIHLQKYPERGIRDEIEQLIEADNNIDNTLYTVDVTQRYVEQARYQFEALELIRTFSVSVGTGEMYISWTLTDKGLRYFSRLKALKRPAAS
jgi:hypothetical protein